MNLFEAIKNNLVEDENTSRDYLKRDWEKLQKEPLVYAREHWSDAYTKEVQDYGKSLQSNNINENADDFKLDINPVSYNDIWLSFTGSGVEGSAKVFIEGSEFGIPRFRKISKLNYSTSDDECNYDRGWDVKPKNKELFTKICKALEAYRDAHPYDEIRNGDKSIYEAVWVPTHEEAVDFGNSLEKVEDTRKPIIAPGLVTQVIDKHQYSDDSWYQFEDLHREEIGEFYRREGTHPADPLEDGDIYDEFKDFLIDYYTKNPRKIPWMSHPIDEAESFDVYSKVMNAPDDALGTLIIDFSDISYDGTKSYIKRHFDLTLGELVRYSNRALNTYSASLSGKCFELKKFLKALNRSTSEEMKDTPELFTQKQLSEPIENVVNDELLSFKILNEAEDNSTKIIQDVIKSKNLPNGTKVSTITDDTFNSIVKDVQSKIPNSDEKEVRNKVAGTLYGMFEESDDIEIRDSSKKAYKTIYNNYSEPIRFQIRNSNGGLLGGSPTLDGAKKIASEKIAEYKDDPWNKDMKVFIERLKESDEEKVKVSLYGDVKEYPTIEDAIEDMKMAMSMCDPNSSEFKRYLDIYYQLKSGKTSCTDNFNEAEVTEDATEKYWDATTLKQDAFLRLMRFNFAEPHGCQYIITNDAYEVERFNADTDEEAFDIYNKFKEDLDSGLVELIPQDLNIKPIVPRD